MARAYHQLQASLCSLWTMGKKTHAHTHKHVCISTHMDTWAHGHGHCNRQAASRSSEWNCRARRDGVGVRRGFRSHQHARGEFMSAAHRAWIGLGSRMR